VMGEDLREFIEEHTLARTFLLGHSLGGKIAMQFATTYPGEVEKLIVVDIAPKTYSPSQKPLLAALRALDLTRIGSFSDANIALTPAIPETALRQFLIKNLNRDETGRFRWRIGLDEIAENYDALTLEVALD